MVNRFPGLWHHAIIGGDNQNHDVGRLGAACAHGGECLVAGSIEEGNHAAVGLDVVSANMLGNATGFSHRHLGAANEVQQRGFAVVDVTHDGNHWRPRLHRHILERGGLLEESIRIVQFGGKRLVAHLLDHDHGRFLIQHLVDGDHRPHLHHHLDDFYGLHRHPVRQIGHRNGFRNMYLADNDFGRRLEAPLALINRVAMLPVTMPATLPRTAGIGRARLDSRLLAAVVDASIAALLGILARCVGFLVQRAFLRCGFLRLRLGGCLLCRLPRQSGGFGRRLGLLAHADQFGFAGQLRLQLLFLNIAQLAIATILLLAGTQLTLTDHRSKRNRRLRLNFRPRLNHRRILDDLCNLHNRLDDRSNLHNRLDDLCNFHNRLDDRQIRRLFDHFGNCLDDRLDNMIARFALDQDTLLAHLDLNRPGTPMRISRLEFRSLLACERNLGLRIVAMGAAQVIEQSCLVLIGQRIGALLRGDTRPAQLFEQSRHRHLEFCGKLRNSCCGHACYPPAHSNQ